MTQHLHTDDTDGTQPVQTPAPELDGIVQSLTKSADLIRALRAEPKHKTELADELGVSKSTVYNWLTELKEYDFVERADDGFRLTTTGRLQADLYREFLATSTRVQEATDILQEIPPAHLPPTAVLTDSPLSVRTSNQYELIHELIAISRDATQITGLCSLLCEPQIVALADQIENHDLQLDIVLSAPAHQTLLEYEATHGRVLTTAENADLMTYQDQFPLGLAVVDSRVYILGLHNETVLPGYVMTESPAAVDWAHDQIDTFRAQARPLTRRHQSDA